MSDFLKSLRTSKQKSSKTRKSMDNYYGSKSERRQLKDRRDTNFNQNPQNEKLHKTLADFAPLTSENISSIAANIERAVEIQETLAESEIMKNNTITALIKNLDDFLTGNSIQPDQHGEPSVTTSYASGTRYTKDEVLDIIKTMRKERATFATIASYLKEKKIPTFSGRGEWHAQTIHRLCK
jgi:inosine/xanthosine triphosphate pyrophosphatase family protein